MTDEQPPSESPADAPADASAGAPPAATPARFSYGAHAEIELGASGFRAPRWPGRGEVFVAYRDVTHVVVEPRALAIGTRFGLVLLNRGQLGGEAPARELAEALRARVFALPGGDERRARFARLDAKQRARRPWIAALLAAVTGVVYALQQLVPGFYDAAIYRPPLLALGEWWRYAATQFLHANPAHLLMNAVSALIAGAFVERSLGRAGTLFVAGAAGFFGALLAIEFFAPAEAPASARIPRMILVIVVALQAALDLLPWLLPRWAAHTAGWAHLGGFAAGALAALLVRDSARALVVLGAAAAVAVSAASFGVVARNLFDPMPALEQRARTMLQGPVVNAMELNNLAWQIATTKAPTPRALEAAAQLAEMAAALTGRSEPTVLDTLAEVYFALGRKDEAIAVIEQAIALAPGDTYYEEQRRRFNGERAADDRPKPPLEQESPTPPDRGAEPGLPPGEIELPPGDEITV